jgi:lysophospholipase L1-like esterase
MRRLLTNLALVTLPALLVLAGALEVVFRTVVPASRPPVTCFDEAAALYRYCPGQGEGQVTLGLGARVRSRWHINGQGWNSEVEYGEEKERQRIAVIGDSYVEALQVDVDRGFPALLRRALGDGFDVYAFGMAGNPLSQYLHLSRAVRRSYAPDLLIVNLVHNDFHESLAEFNPGDTHLLTLSVRGDQVVENAPRPNRALLQYRPAKRMLIRSALFRYLWFNTRLASIWRSPHKVLGDLFASDEQKYAANIDVRAAEARREPVRRATAYVLAALRTENPGLPILVVMNASRRPIYTGKPRHPGITFLHELVAEECARNGLERLDLTEPMTRDFRAHGRRFEFEVDNHWNEYGHRLVAREIQRKLVAMGVAGPSSGTAR